MKTREPRRQVLIKARMRVGARWGDVRILNLSRRGLMAQAAQPPERGTYLEVRRGAQAIVARVVWTASNRFGAITQDPLDVDAIVRNPTGEVAAAEASAVADRRAVPRHPRSADRAERNRWLGRAVEFAGIAGFGLGLAVLVGQGVRNVLAAPLHATSASLEPTGAQ